MKKLILIILLLVLLFGCNQVKQQQKVILVNESENKTIEPTKIEDNSRINLSGFPSMFIKNNIFNGFLVIGDNASLESTLGAARLAYDLQYKSAHIIIPAGTIKVASEIKNTKNQNIISIGDACENSITSSFLSNPINCNEGMQENKGYIKLLKNGDKVALLVYGYPSNYTADTVDYLSYYYENNLTGDSMEIDAKDMQHLIRTNIQIPYSFDKIKYSKREGEYSINIYRTSKDSVNISIVKYFPRHDTWQSSIEYPRLQISKQESISTVITDYFGDYGILSAKFSSSENIFDITIIE